MRTNLQTANSCGGGKRDRTADLLHAMQALSQLSYTPDRGRELYPSAGGEGTGQAVQNDFPAKEFQHRVDRGRLRLAGDDLAQRHRELRHLQVLRLDDVL